MPTEDMIKRLIKGEAGAITITVPLMRKRFHDWSSFISFVADELRKLLKPFPCKFRHKGRSYYRRCETRKIEHNYAQYVVFYLPRGKFYY